MSFRAKRRRVVEGLPEKYRRQPLYVNEILLPYGRLDDNYLAKYNYKT